MDTPRDVLIEVVSLLTRAHEQHAAQSNERLAALERRLAGVEDTIAHLRSSLDGAADERLTELRARLSSAGGTTEGPLVRQVVDSPTPRPSSTSASSSTSAVETSPPAPEQASAPRAPVAPPRHGQPSLEQRLASQVTQDRAGLVCIAAGVLALVYAAFTFVHY